MLVSDVVSQEPRIKYRRTATEGQISAAPCLCFSNCFYNFLCKIELLLILLIKWKHCTKYKTSKNCLKQSSDFYRSVCLCAGGVARCSSVLTSPWQIQDNKNFQVPMLSPLDQVFSGSDFSDSVQQGDKKNYNFGVVSLRTFLWQGWTTSCLYLCFTWKCRRVEVKKVVKQKFSFSSRVYLAVHTQWGQGAVYAEWGRPS